MISINLLLKDDERRNDDEILKYYRPLNEKIWKTNIGFVYLFTNLFYLYVIEFMLSFEILLLTGKSKLNHESKKHSSV